MEPHLWGATSESYRKVLQAVMLILIARLRESIRLCFREKLLKECYRYPYRQPTKVDWSSRLRYTSDRDLRNSA